jgi:Icc-related predicted phosphoesterase
VRLNFVSDVHGSVEALRRSADGADALVCLGDFVLFIDYAEPGNGIFGALFGEENTRRYIELRTAGSFDEARAWSRELWTQVTQRVGVSREELVDHMIKEQYRELFEALPTPAYLTYGNVDVPDFWPEFLRDGHTVLDAQTVDIGGLRFGFIGGGLVSPMRTPYELDEHTYAEHVAALGPVDVLCSHIPPAVPELLYDTVARRFEHGSTALVDYIREHQPRYSVFGHVHQPLAARARIGRTECVNVGHFRGGAQPFSLEW